MSYILDALKRAERDRRRARVPSLTTQHALPPERRWPWPWIVGGVLAVNALVLLALFAFRSTPLPVTSLPAPPPSAVQAEPPRSTPAVAARPAEPAPTGVTTGPHETPPAAKQSSAKREEPAARSSIRGPSEDKAARAVPEALKLEVLIYSDNAAERAAYINGLRYVEGQRLDGRTVVERIDRDGVVLAAGGKRYVLKQE